MGCGRKVGPFDCCEIIHGNSLELVTEIPDGYTNLVITDPPYGIGLEYDGYKDSEENLKQIISKIMPECFRISPLTIMTTGIPQMFLYPQPTWVLCWFYNWTNYLTSWGVNTWQPILCYGKDPRAQGLKGDSIQMSAPAITGLVHPCPKPPRLWLHLINRCFPEQTSKIIRVVDPFSGSGTTARVCKVLGFHYLCFEQSEKYVKEARHLLDNTSDIFPEFSLDNK
jgi:DNA methylase